MIRDDRPGYWRATRRLMAVVILVALAVGLVVHLLIGRAGDFVVFGLPVGYLAAALAAPIALAGLVFWFAARQDEVDRLYGMAEED